MLKGIRISSLSVLGLAALSLAMMGQTCAPPSTPVTPAGGGSGTVHVELLNQTLDPVNPGLVVNGAPLEMDPPHLAPGETATMDLECVGGTTIQTDAAQMAPLGPVPSDNTPLVQDDDTFHCGDTVTLILVDNGVDVFFTRAEVNGQFVSD